MHPDPRVLLSAFSRSPPYSCISHHMSAVAPADSAESRLMTRASKRKRAPAQAFTALHGTGVKPPHKLNDRINMAFDIAAALD